MQSKPKWLALFLFAMSLIYLIPEVIFNAKLVEVAGSSGLSDETLHITELFGRAISGIGVTLLMIDLLVSGRVAAQKRTAIPAMVVVALIVWPTTFFGQKWLVDYFIIDSSSAEQRQNAFMSNVLRSSLAQNALRIEGIPFEPEHATSAHEMTFLALMGGLIYSNDSFINDVDKQKNAILEKYLLNRAGARFDEDYAVYRDMRKDVHVAWGDYKQANKQYNDAVASRHNEANKAWSNVESDVLKGWKRYQSAEKSYLMRAEGKAQELAPKISQAFDEKNNCISRYSNIKHQNKCIKTVESHYRQGLAKYGLPYKEMNYWLVTEKGRVKGTTTVSETILTLGLSAVLAGLELATGDGGEQDQHLVYSSKPSDYVPNILNLMKGEFKSETGYSMGIATFSQFRHHKITARNIVRKSKNKGVQLATNWTINDVTAFKNAVRTTTRDKAKRKWNKEMAKRDLSIPPGLNFNQFQKHSSIQNQIKQSMGEEYYVNPVLTTWNNKQFYKNVTLVNVQRERDKWLAYINSSVVRFEDGGLYENEGKSALRSIIVPPISMSLSLFLVLITFFKLPFKFWALLSYGENEVSTSKSKRMNHVAALAVIIAIFSVPLLMGNSKFTDEGSTTAYFLKSIDNSVSPLTSSAITWVLHSQPSIQPIGMAFDKNFHVFSLFEKHVLKPINDWDEKIYPLLSIDQYKQTEPKVVNGKVAMFVRSNVSENRIRILNIKPKYQDGMLLQPDSYYVEVSASGYRPVKKWVTHNRDNNEHVFFLNKK
ncbi:hypothetical protein [Photobacterium sanguinicancri]|uniref:hypothetical protein n=1 Tax=Photobacterium sanguinicancri TaxID=875932 RepID=UPI0021C257E6|nr:hypothetical protein [Photobacterium sanguinicancri]